MVTHRMSASLSAVTKYMIASRRRGATRRAFRLAATLKGLIIVGCAVVLTNYGPSRRLKGVLGGIGPTRMAYSQTVARLRAVAHAASDRMAQI